MADEASTTASNCDPLPPARFTYLVKQLQEALRASLNEITQRFDMTPKQYAALTVLAQSRAMSSATLARVTFVTPQAANEMVTTLERKGFLIRSVDKTNRRRLDVTLTRNGRSALTRCDHLVDGLEAEVLKDLSPADQSQLKQMLHTCLRTLSEVPAL